MVTILKDQIFLGQRISNTLHKKFILWFYFYIRACKRKASGTHTSSHTREDTLFYLADIILFFQMFLRLKHIFPSMRLHVNFKEYKVQLWFIYTFTQQNVTPWETTDVQKTAGYFSVLWLLRHRTTTLANYKQNYLLVRFISIQSWGGGKCSFQCALCWEGEKKKKQLGNIRTEESFRFIPLTVRWNKQENQATGR